MEALRHLIIELPRRIIMSVSISRGVVGVEGLKHRPRIRLIRIIVPGMAVAVAVMLTTSSSRPSSSSSFLK